MNEYHHAPAPESEMKSPKIDFTDLDEANRILGSGTEEELQQLKSYALEHGYTEEDFEQSVEHQRLRLRVLKEMEQELSDRIDTSPEPTQEELDLGAYMELIEPQVRDALVEMRSKGFNTISTGFADYNDQQIVFSESLVKKIGIEGIQKLGDLGMRFNQDASAVFFTVKDCDIEVIKQQWDELAAALPDLGEKAPPSTTPIAKSFRNKMADENYDWYRPKE